MSGELVGDQAPVGDLHTAALPGRARSGTSDPRGPCVDEPGAGATARTSPRVIQGNRAGGRTARRVSHTESTISAIASGTW